MKNVQNRLDLSDNALLDLAGAFRSDGIEIEPGLKDEIYESSTLLEEFFEVQEMVMEVKIENKTVLKPKPVVLCKNLDGFVDFIKQKRNVKNPVALKYGADGGGKHSKNWAQIFEIFEIYI